MAILSTSQSSNIEKGRKPLIPLPEIKLDQDQLLPRILQRRRSVRYFHKSPLPLETLSSLLWAAQGISSPNGYRTAPSAGALYPIILYSVVESVDSLDPGIYRYHPEGHLLERIRKGNFISSICRIALGQWWMEDCSFLLVIGADYEKTTWKYGERGIRYVHMEVGHVAQNVHLLATELELGTVVVGAFDDEKLHNLLVMNPGENPLCLMPVGIPG
ncbi:MAG: SagB/ThcOx family dehydrogenase [Calditrichaeota bacterium]|nr:MAG: SagB/ThcOx family dehydrogenase [Calditrichota bacterium]